MKRSRSKRKSRARRSDDEPPSDEGRDPGPPEAWGDAVGEARARPEGGRTEGGPEEAREAPGQGEGRRRPRGGRGASRDPGEGTAPHEGRAGDLRGPEGDRPVPP